MMESSGGTEVILLYPTAAGGPTVAGCTRLTSLMSLMLETGTNNVLRGLITGCRASLSSRLDAFY